MVNHKKLRRLKANTARYLLKLIEQICSHPFAGQELPRAPRQRRKVSRWRLTTLFSEAAVKSDLLPLGYQWCGNKDLAERLQHQAQTPPSIQISRLAVIARVAEILTPPSSSSAVATRSTHNV